MTKAELRREASARRATAHIAAPDAGDRLPAVWPRALAPPPGAVVGGYHPIGTEIDPRPLLHALCALGLRLALPCTPTRGANAPLTFRLWRGGEPLIRSAFGVPEPGAGAPIATPTLVLVPLLAFDRTGARLGYGAGHYDRTLPPLLAADPSLRAIGVAFAAQEVARVPAEPHDHPLDGVLTPEGYIAAKKL